MPILARSKPWFEFTPMAGTVQLAIVPSVRRMLFLCRNGESQGEGAADEGGKDLAPMMHIGSHGMRLDFGAALSRRFDRNAGVTSRLPATVPEVRPQGFPGWVRPSRQLRHRLRKVQTILGR